MAVQQELWSSIISENLFDAISPILAAATDDGKEGNAKTIHVPAAGAAGTILTNPSRPLTAAARTDVDHSYDMTEFVMPPRWVTYADYLNLSYDKLKSLLNDISMGLPDRVMKEFTINWYPGAAGDSVTTSGGNAVAHATGATGTRKSLTYENLVAAAVALDKQGIPSSDRYLIVDATMFGQLVENLGITTYRDAAILNPSTMDLPPVAGFKVIKVHQVAYAATSTYAVRAYGHGGATTDHALALACHKSALSYGYKGAEVFVDLKSAIYAGDVVSGAVYAGAKYRRSDRKGVVTIRQIA